MKILLSSDEQRHLSDIVARLSPTGVMVEYGCGGSTPWFQSQLRDGQRIYSIEHNVQWFETVRGQLGTEREWIAGTLRHAALAFDKATLLLCQSSEDKGIYTYAQPQEEIPVGLTDYINPSTIPWPDVEFVFVDGIARGAVLMHLALALHKDTTVCVHDYVGRETWYDWAIAHYNRIAVTDTLIELRTFRC